MKNDDYIPYVEGKHRCVMCGEDFEPDELNKYKYCGDCDDLFQDPPEPEYEDDGYYDDFGDDL